MTMWAWGYNSQVCAFLNVVCVKCEQLHATVYLVLWIYVWLWIAILYFEMLMFLWYYWFLCVDCFSCLLNVCFSWVFLWMSTCIMKAWWAIHMLCMLCVRKCFTVILNMCSTCICYACLFECVYLYMTVGIWCVLYSVLQTGKKLIMLISILSGIFLHGRNLQLFIVLF